MMNFDETSCRSTFIPQTSESQHPQHTPSPVSSVFSYAIGPLAPAQFRPLQVSLSNEDGQYTLLVPVHLPPELLTDPDFFDSAEYGYLEGNPQEEIWSVPKLVNELYWNLNELRERPELDIYPWTPGFLLGMLASIAEQDCTLALIGLAHFSYLFPHVVEVVYNKDPVQAQLDPSFCVAIDLGVTNLAAITSNPARFLPRLVNGRPLKAINQWYNKRMKELTLCLPKAERERVTKQMQQITTRRNRRVNHYLHAASKAIIDFLVEQGVGTLIIGKNPFWKQEVRMGKRNNQNFVNIPHARFIDMLTYKAELVGIQVKIQEESYTSTASFLDLDPLPTYTPDDETEYTFSGKRIGRRNRLYRTKDGRKICADINGSYNILRKSKPDAFAHVDAKGIAAYVVQPLRLAIPV